MYYAYRLFLLYCQDRLAITIALLSYASYVATWAWSWKGRVDMLSVALTIGCLYALEVAVRSSSEITADREAAGVSKAGAFKRLAPYSLSIALLVAAVYSKQSCLVILPVVCIFLLARRRYIDAIYYGVVCTIACLIIALALQAITGGGFMLHMDVAKKTQGTANLLKHLELFGVDWLKIWFVPVLAVFWGLSKNRQGKSLAHLLLPLLLAAVGAASIIFTIGTKYANINHAIPFFFALSWLLAIFLEARPCLGGLLFILLSGLSTYIISTCLPQKFYVLEKMDKTLEQLHDLKVRGKTIFVEDPSLGIASGATPLFVDVATFIMVWENEHQTKQLSEIEAAIQKREYPVVIINENDSLEHQPFYYWNDAFMRQLNENYEKGSPVAANGEVQIMYIPRSSVHPKESFIAPSKSSSQPGK